MGTGLFHVSVRARLFMFRFWALFYFVLFFCFIFVVLLFRFCFLLFVFFFCFMFDFIDFIVITVVSIALMLQI